jgi:hypothetical protein
MAIWPQRPLKTKTKGVRKRPKSTKRNKGRTKNILPVIICIHTCYETRTRSTGKDQCSAGDISASIHRAAISEKRKKREQKISRQIRAQKRKVERDANFSPFTYLWYMLVVNEVETWLDGDRDGGALSGLWSSATTVTSITSPESPDAGGGPWRRICILRT